MMYKLAIVRIFLEDPDLRKCSHKLNFNVNAHSCGGEV